MGARTYITSIILYSKKVLLENNYLSKLKSKYHNNKHIEIPTQDIFNKNLIIQGLSNIYTKDLLQKIKTEIIAQYEDEIVKLKLLSESIKDKHSATHRKVLRNTEKLLSNLSIVNTAIDNITETQSEIVTHLKEKLMLEQIEAIIITPKKK